MKILRCSDLIPGGKAVIGGKDVTEVMAKGTEHAQKDHGMAIIPPEMAKKVQAVIKGQVVL